MPRIRFATEKLIKYGKFQLQRQVLDLPNILQFVGSDEAGSESSKRSVSLATLRQLAFSDESRKSLTQALYVLRALKFRCLPPIIDIDSTGPTGDIWVINEWVEGRSVREFIASVKKSGRELDISFALYVLKSLTSAVSVLHRCRVSELKTVHGAISPDTIWIDSKGEIYLYNYFFGLAVGFQQGYSMEETVDLRGLGETFWTLITGEQWIGPERAEELQLSKGSETILGACGLVPGSACWSVREFTRVLNNMISAEPYFISRNYVTSWMSRVDRAARIQEEPTPPVEEQRETEPARKPPIATPIVTPIATRIPKRPEISQPARRPVPWLRVSAILSVLVAISIIFTMRGSIEDLLNNLLNNKDKVSTSPKPQPPGHSPGETEQPHQGQPEASFVEFNLLEPRSGVTVTIDQLRKEVLPSPEKISVPPGKHHFSFAALGYLTLEIDRNIPENGDRIPIAMNKPEVVATGELKVVSLVEVTVREGGKEIGNSLRNLKLVPGSHTLEIHYGSLGQIQHVEIVAGKTTQLDVNFEVSVSINARPFAMVSVKTGKDVRELGTTPIKEAKVTIGGVLEFSNENYPGIKTLPITANTPTFSVTFP